MSGPSDKARKAAVDAYDHNLSHPVTTALKAAHDSALGLDRSVCLRDVVEALRTYEGEEIAGAPFPQTNYDQEIVADFIEREFGGGS